MNEIISKLLILFLISSLHAKYIVECNDNCESMLNSYPNSSLISIGNLQVLICDDFSPVNAKSSNQNIKIHDDFILKAYQSVETQNDVKNWALGRIDSRNNNDFTQFSYPIESGNGSYIYIVDSGVDENHAEFLNVDSCDSRVIFGTSFLQNPSQGDVNGHGTFVAGQAIGNTVGVARQAKVISVQVLDENGETRLSDVIQAAQWILNDAQERNITFGSSVINLSLGSSYSLLLNQVLNEISDNGIPIVVAAGNDARSACLFSPASAQKVISVGSIDKNDKLTQFSNNGRCVDLYAPGQQVYSSSYEDAPILSERQQSKCSINSQFYTQLDGTSFSAPLVAGIVALYQSVLKQNQSVTLNKDQDYSQAMKSLVIEQASQQNVQRQRILIPYVFPYDTGNSSGQSLNDLKLVLFAQSLIIIFMSIQLL